jgi:hypothetical protein
MPPHHAARLDNGLKCTGFLASDWWLTLLRLVGRSGGIAPDHFSRIPVVGLYVW